MRITTIEYRRLVNLGRYENETLSATLELLPGENPDTGYRTLREWLDEQLGIRQPEAASASAMPAAQGEDRDDIPF